MKFSNADGLVYTSSIAIYAQGLHQLGQIVFNPRSNSTKKEEQDLLDQLKDTCKKLEDNLLKLKELVKSTE